jgi:hypothetical protein
MTRRRLLASATVIALAGCAIDSVTPDEPRHVEAMPIAPYEIHEECATLAPGYRLDYRFEATAPVDFSLYYKDGIAFVSPVSHAAVREFAGVFHSRDRRRYCLQWEAGQAGAIVSFRIRVMHKGPAP